MLPPSLMQLQLKVDEAYKEAKQFPTLKCIGCSDTLAKFGYGYQEHPEHKTRTFTLLNSSYESPRYLWIAPGASTSGASTRMPITKNKHSHNLGILAELSEPCFAGRIQLVGISGLMQLTILSLSKDGYPYAILPQQQMSRYPQGFGDATKKASWRFAQRTEKILRPHLRQTKYLLFLFRLPKSSYLPHVSHIPQIPHIQLSVDSAMIYALSESVCIKLAEETNEIIQQEQKAKRALVRQVLGLPEEKQKDLELH